MLQAGQTGFDSYLNELGKYYRGDSRYNRLRNGQIAAVQDFQEPYPTPASTELLGLAFMELLNRYVYPQIQGRAKFTLQFKLKTDNDITDITLTKAIMLTYADGTLIPKELIFQEIYKAVLAQAENYGDSEVLAVCVRSYSDGCLDMNLVRFPTKEESDLSIKNTFYKYYQINNLKNASWSKKQTKKARYNTYITKDTQVLKNKTKFMVADLETIPYKIGENDENKTHVPYAGGYMTIDTEKGFDPNQIVMFYADDYKLVYDDFQSMSTKMLTDMMNRMLKAAKSARTCMVVYFHNLGQFDGLFILRHLTMEHRGLLVDPMVRNRVIYKITVYTVSASGKRRNLLSFQDSYHLFKRNLEELGSCFCPELKGKGVINHDNVSLDNLGSNKEDYLSYLKQDISLLGAVMLKAKAIYFDLYQIDILTRLTISSLALSIFRRQYIKDSEQNRIYILNDNEEQFIRSGYYGGHTDVYLPSGEDLKYYDINSLYPYSMLSDMPAGKPRWILNLGLKKSKMELKDMFGFIKAFVIAPAGMHKPFLPYKQKDGTLIFPTGRFIGVYFSEELKYAESIGYKVYPICGYLFDRVESPFKEFVYDIYRKRLDAKAKGEKALDFIHKTTMNSLYGRFGINPESTSTLILNEEEALKFPMEHEGFMHSEELCEDRFLITYKNVRSADLLQKREKPPANAAVQISAAVTGYARIHMYPYISREDCYYTDTDSIIVKHPLPAEVVSATELGAFKLEHNVTKGVFLAPKSYMLQTLDDPYLKRTFEYELKFSRNWHKLLVEKKTAHITMGIESKKREFVFDKHGKWVGTKPIHIGEGGVNSLNPTSYKLVRSLLEQNEYLQKELRNSDSENIKDSRRKKASKKNSDMPEKKAE
ncbi:hypothetical protein PVAP13_J672500 [Panicum virgatum]|nr:hypothetical protein PVAP13_J672500 [Panicum virgatum]